MVGGGGETFERLMIALNLPDERLMFLLETLGRFQVALPPFAPAPKAATQTTLPQHFTATAGNNPLSSLLFPAARQAEIDSKLRNGSLSLLDSRRGDGT